MAVDLDAIRHLFSIANADGPTLRDEMAMKMIEEIESLSAEVARVAARACACPVEKNDCCCMADLKKALKEIEL